MLMSMLVAGGCPPANDHRPPYEGDPANLTGRDLAGQCVKLIHGGRVAEVPHGPTRNWTFVWLDRDPVEQARSHVKFLRAVAPVTGAGPVGGDEVLIPTLAASYAADRPALLGQLRRIGPVLVLDYGRIVAQPRKASRLLRRDVWPGLDVDAAAVQVQDRDPRCSTDVSTELAQMNRGGR